MAYPSQFTYPGHLLFPGSLLANWPPPGPIPRSIGPRPLRPVTRAPAGSVPPVPPWRPKVDIDAEIFFDVEIDVSIEISVEVDVPITFSPMYVADATGGSVEEAVDVPIGYEVEVLAVPSFVVEAPLEFDVDVDARLASIGDTFDRADGVLGTAWSSTTPAPVISSNKAQAGVSGSNQDVRPTAVFAVAMPGDDMSVTWVTAVPTGNDSNSLASGAFLRSTSSVSSGTKVALVANTDGGATIFTVTGTEWTSRASYSGKFPPWSVIEFRAVGNVYSGFLNGATSPFLTWTDSAGVADVGPSNRHFGIRTSATSNFAGTATRSPAIDSITARAI